MNFLKNILFKWEIPGYQYFLKYGGYIGLLSLWIFINAGPYKEYGERWWFLLMIIMLIWPLANVFPKVGLFTKIKWLRKPLWIIAWSFMIAHALWYFLHYKGVINPISMMQDASFWTLESGLLWGTLWVLIAIPLLLTSNEFSVKHMGKYWKALQRLSHLVFIFAILHIIFITNFKKVWILTIFFIYLILHILDFFNIRW